MGRRGRLRGGEQVTPRTRGSRALKQIYENLSTRAFKAEHFTAGALHYKITHTCTHMHTHIHMLSHTCAHL